MLLVILLSFVKFCDPSENLFILFSINKHMHVPIHLQYSYPGNQHQHHPSINAPCFGKISLRHPRNKRLDYGWPKERKGGMLKKHGQRKKRGGVDMSQKKKGGDDKRERANVLRSKPYLHTSIHPSTHLHIFDRDCMTCFSMDPLFDFTQAGAPQRLYIDQGRLKADTALVRIIKVECFERIILGNFAMFSKIFFKKILQRDRRSVNK